MSNPPDKKSLILCVHAHQPVGNFENVFAEAYEKCYRPFFEVLDRHRGIPMSCHLSGSLLDWIETNRPEFIRLLRSMAARGQVEFLGGAYYEPIYGAIPKKDLSGQLKLMAERLELFFGTRPEGAWLTERVWDPDLVKPLSQAGVRYTVLDDLHLEQAGIPAPVTGFYQTRQGAASLDVFASIKHLRYLMPFRKAEDTLDYIHSLDAGPEDALVFADDCEKFGLWPGTYGWVYQEKWLDQLFTLLEKDRGITLDTFSRFRRRHKSQKTVNIPHASYSEMMEWSGGRFYNFFDKYPESAYMRDRMLAVSRDVERGSFSKKRNENFGKAKKALYMAQCNCSYWHGVFGGLYLHHLRSAVFENLIKADHFLDGAPTKPGSQAKIEPHRSRSGVRWKLRQKEITTYFNQNYGAALEELDFIPMSVNLMCNLQRHRELYHRILSNGHTPMNGHASSIHQLLGSKEKNLDKILFYDPVRRLSFLDHFFAQPLSLEDFQRSQYTELGDFVDKPYRLFSRRDGANARLVFQRRAALKLAGESVPFSVTKTVLPKGHSGLRVQYTLKNHSSKNLRFVFGVEFNFSIGDLSAMKGFSKRKGRTWTFNDSWRGIELKLSSDAEADLLGTAVETVSGSEAGLEKTYQQLGVLLQKEMHLKGKETKEQLIELEVR